MTFNRSIMPIRQLSTLTLPSVTLEKLQSVASSIRTGTTANTLLLTGSRSNSEAAAEAVAHDTGRTLLHIDLAGISSRYLGDTEKNLDRLFATTDPAQTILFFDEADALFGKRSELKDGHDRYANIEISSLLRRIESFGGLAILATSSAVESPTDKPPVHIIRLPD